MPARRPASSSSCERTYAAVCRALIELACSERQITKVQLAKELGIHKQTICTLGVKGLLGFDLALRIAELGKAPVELLAELERAWFMERAAADARGPLRRLLRLSQLQAEEIGRLETFLREQGLLDEYVQKRRTWNPKLGVIGTNAQAKGGRPRKRRP